MLYNKNFKENKKLCQSKAACLSPKALEDQELKRKIIEFYIRADKRYGPVKINGKLAGVGINIGVSRVTRLMNEMTLPKMSTVKPKAAKQKENTADTDLQNILHQSFNAAFPNGKWVSDITYIKAEGRWYYLCIIMDLFARKIIGWKTSARINTQLCNRYVSFGL